MWPWVVNTGVSRIEAIGANGSNYFGRSILIDRDELKEKLTENDKKNIENGLKDLREVLTGDDIEKIKEKTDVLSEIIQKASTAIYQQAAQEAAKQQTNNAEQSKDGSSWSGNPSGDDKTIDVDYNVKDDKGKKDKKE